jgi:LmbE family N-acetylglucosaminyl deacetylase
MRLTKEKAAGVVRWLGLSGGRRQLEGDFTVVSPHLDDAVLSLGAAISAARGRATVLTVLAGDVDSQAPAGFWDRSAGFETAGEAARARRQEDARACAVLGAEPRWLPYSDDQYDRGGDDDEIRAAVQAAAADGAVLIPGFPLLHPDHRWLRQLLDGLFEPERTVVYAEQPYAALFSARPGDRQEAPGVPPPERWGPLAAGVRNERRKLAACRAYKSQLPLLGSVLIPILRYELRFGGESAAWLDGT